MGKTLHLHIGWPKCASTTIQKMCALNQAQLMELGYYYPIIGGVSGMGNGTPLWQAFDRGKKFLNRHPGMLDFDDVETFFRKNFLNTEHEHVLISSENLFSKAIKHDFSFVFDSFDAVKVYWVIRPRIQRAQSRYLHMVRNGKVKLEIGDYITECERLDKVPFPGNYMRSFNFWSKIASGGDFKILMLQSGFEPIQEQFLKACVGRVPQNMSLDNSSHQKIGAVPTAAIMSLEADFENHPQYLKKIKHIRQTARKLRVHRKTVNILTADVADRLATMFYDDETAFAAAQSDYTMDDLNPDISQIVASSTTLASVREWKDYRRLKKALAKDGIYV